MAHGKALVMRAIVASAPILVVSMPPMVHKTQEGRPYRHPDIKANMPRPDHTYRAWRRNVHFDHIWHHPVPKVSTQKFYVSNRVPKSERTKGQLSKVLA